MATVSPSVRPHALVFPYPVQGHLTPMMHFSHALAASGFLVTFVTTHYRLAHIVHARQNQTTEHLFSTYHHQIRLVGLPDGLPPDHDRNPVSITFLDSVANLGAEFEALLQRLAQAVDADHDPPVTCIVSDSFLPWTQDVADKWRIPRVFFWTQSMAVGAAYISTSKIISGGYDPLAGTVKARGALPLSTCIPGLPAIDPYDLPFNCEIAFPKANMEWLLQVLNTQFGRINEAAWVVVNSFDELEGQIVQDLRGDVPKILLLGPLSQFTPEDREGEPFRASLWEEEDCLQWLGTQKPSSVLYISFGSVVTRSDELMKEIGMGLLASQQPFLWAVRWGWERAKEIFPPEFLDFTKERGKLIKWAPQIRVLSHASVGGFLTHCGWNSTIESVSAGVPMLAYPNFLDQYTNSWSVVFKWKVGLEIKRGVDGSLERGEVERAVRMLMQEEEGKEARRRASTLREAATQAWQEHGNSRINLASFVEDMFQRAHCQAQH